MKIEISKKQLIVAVITIAVVAISFTGGYFFGFDKGVESSENPKGDGENFYVEMRPEEVNNKFSTRIIYHSTLNCPEIKAGVECNDFGITYDANDGTTKAYPYYLCHKCMDKDLIENCEMRIRNALEYTLKK